MSRIGPDHLSRGAVVYVRQSTTTQLRRNHESRRRQYGLADRARELGWAEPAVIDEDLGRSGGGGERPGFERLLVAICEGRVGIVLSLEASRLARNGRDWHTLLEFCGLVGCLLGDEHGVYDPRLPNDRLLLGMKGTLSEMELSTLRQRSVEALRLKASRGELFLGVAVGFVKVRRDRIAKDPDRRVQEAVGLVFRKFAEFRSVRQVHLWLRQEEVLLPSVRTADGVRRVEWKPPVYNTVRHMLTNPVYAGAYVFGRTGSRVTVENGRKRVVRGNRRRPEDWDVLIRDHHEGYVAWEDFERNQRLIADNANCRGLMARGAVRRGDALLAGLLRCGHCGRRLHVHYTGNRGYCVRYGCRGADINHGTGPCIGFGGLRVDAAVADEVLRLLSPLGVEAALAAVGMREADDAEARRQVELALTQARYEADLARRQYDAVDPANRLVAAELERRWNDRLAEVRRHEERLADAAEAGPGAPTAAERERLLALGDDLPAAWSHPGATAETRKRILRAVLEEIVVELGEGRIDLLAALARRRPHAARRAAQPHGAAPLPDRRGDRRSGPRAGQAAAGRRHRRDAEPPGAQDRPRQHLDRGPGAQPPQQPRRGRPPAGRDGGARRTDADGGRRAARREHDDGAAAYRRRDDRRRAGLQGGALGHPRGAVGRPRRPAIAGIRSANSRGEPGRAALSVA